MDAAMQKWKNWCRLCARSDGSDLKPDTINKLAQLLLKFFMYTIPSRSDESLTICQDCVDLLLHVEKFALRCVKVNEMFTELCSTNISDDKINAIRHALDYNDQETNQNDENAIGSPVPTPNLPCKDEINELHFVDLAPTNVTRSLRSRRTKAEVKQSLCDSDSEEPDHTRSFADESTDDHNDDDDDDNDASYKPSDSCNSKKVSVSPTVDVDRQAKAIHCKRRSDAKTNRSTAKKRKKIHTDCTKPATISVKRKPIKGTDVWCHLCDKTFDLPRHYMNHMRIKHTPDVLAFECGQCPKVFVSQQKMLQHAARHRPNELKKTHPCPECGKTFTKTETVQLHIRIVHMGERPFVCEECGKSCATKGALKEHQLKHSENRPFMCDECSKCFKDLPALKKHSETHETASFECQQCGQRLNTRQTLKIHMLVHSDERRYKCQHCGNAYKRYPALKNHLILHTGMRPYACPFCDVTYANGSNLRNHKKKCHPVELAAMEAAGQVTPAPAIPNAKYMQPNFSHAETADDCMLDQQET